MIRTAILLGFGLTLIFLALRSLRAHRLRERYVLLFMAIGLPFLLLGFWPDGIVALSTLLRIEKATLLVLLVAGCLILVVFELLSIVSVHERRIAVLAQHVAILMTTARSPGPLEAPAHGAGVADQDPA